MVLLRCGTWYHTVYNSPPPPPVIEVRCIHISIWNDDEEKTNQTTNNNSTNYTHSDPPASQPPSMLLHMWVSWLGVVNEVGERNGLENSCRLRLFLPPPLWLKYEVFGLLTQTGKILMMSLVSLIDFGFFYCRYIDGHICVNYSLFYNENCG